MARLAITTAGDAKSKVEDDIPRVLDVLAAVEEDRRRSEAEITRQAIKRPSLLLELDATKDEVSPFIPKWARIRKPWKKTTRRP